MSRGLGDVYKRQALSPITGELIAQMIATGKSGISLDAFRLSRFTVEAEKPEVSHV